MKAMMTALFTGAMLGVGTLSASALAVDNENSAAQQSQSSSESQQNNPQYHGEFAGEVIGVRTATFANDKKYQLVKIRSKKGDVAVLNLGPVKQLKNNNTKLQEGDSISANGVSGRINDKPVLVVYQLRVINQGNDQGASQANGQSESQ